MQTRNGGDTKKYPQKEVVYKLYLSPQLFPICTHAKYFSLLIRHLLNNARKFIQTGEIQLKAEPDQKNKKINITITDSQRQTRICFRTIYQIRYVYSRKWVGTLSLPLD